MLAYISNGTPKIWTGQEVNGVLHPLNVEFVWKDADLNAAGLYRVTPFRVPDGQQTTGEPTYTLSGSVVLESYQTVALTPTPVTFVTARQARLALLPNGLLDATQKAIDADTTGELKIWWEYSTGFDRNHPKLLQVAGILGLRPEQIDALFATAATL
jgi:hypothetical protein